MWFQIAGCNDTGFDTINGSYRPKNSTFIWTRRNVYIFHFHNNFIFDKGKFHFPCKYVQQLDIDKSNLNLSDRRQIISPMSCPKFSSKIYWNIDLSISISFFLKTSKYSIETETETETDKYFGVFKSMTLKWKLKFTCNLCV